MEQRLLLAFVLMGVVVFVTPYIIPQPPAEEVSVEEQANDPNRQPVLDIAEEDPAEPAAPDAQDGEAAEAEEAAQPVAAAQEQTLTFENDRARVVFSNRGAVVRSWTLQDYTDGAENPLELVNQAALEQNVPAPFSILFGNQIAGTDPNTVLYQMQRTTDGVRFQYSGGGTRIEKTFSFEPDTFLLSVSSQVIDNGVAVPHSLTWRGGFGDDTVDNPSAYEYASYYEGGLEQTDAGDVDEPTVTLNNGFAFAGVEDKYFAAIALTGVGDTATSALQFRTLADTVRTEDDEEAERVGVAIGGSGNNQLHLFVGPKDRDILTSVDPRLDELIDWGFFGFLARPLFYLLVLIADNLTQNYGWAIVVLTIGINFVLMPLRVSSIKSSRKMAAIQPQMNALNEKYKGLPMNDPKRANQREEMQALYDKHGVSMTGGCLPMLMQMPVFIAFYTVLSVAIEMRHSSWLWVNDLSQPETLAIRALPILLVVTQFLTQKLTPAAPGMDPAMQKSMMLMPLFLGFMFYYQSAGLVLYWLTSNVVGIGQQAALNKMYPAQAPVEVIPPASKKKKKR